MHRENRENGQTNSVRENTGNLEIFAKTQGIWFAQAVNSLILKVQCPLFRSPLNSNLLVTSNWF